MTRLARYLAPWLVLAIAIPLIFPWLWLLRPMEGDLPYWIFTFQFVLWPTSVVLWDDKHFMPVLLTVPAFWYSTVANVLVYSGVGLAFWLTRQRHTWVRYMLSAVWLFVFGWMVHVNGLAF